MSKNTSILLSDHFADRKKGERSSFVTDFIGDVFLNELHLKHTLNGCLKERRATNAPRG